MPHLLESSRRLELLVARLADSRFILPLGGIARSFDRGSELKKERKKNSKESESRKQHLVEQITHIITMVESIG